jgi:hypothetical protein
VPYFCVSFNVTLLVIERPILQGAPDTIPASALRAVGSDRVRSSYVNCQRPTGERTTTPRQDSTSRTAQLDPTLPLAPARTA